MSQMRLALVVEAVDRISKPLRGAERRMRRFAGRVQALNRRVGFDRLGRSLRRAGQAARGVIGQVGRLATQVGVLGTAAAGATAGLLHGFARTGEETRQWAARLGLATEELSRLQYAGQQFGVQGEAMRDTLKELSMRTDEYVQMARSPGAEAFERLGLSQEALNKVSGDTAALFELVMQRPSEVENVAARQRLVDEIFGGQGGEQMAEMASLSASELAALREEADRVGATIGSDGARASQRYMRAWRKLQGAMSGVRRTVGAELLPALTRLLKNLTRLVVDHQDDIRRWAAQFADSLPDRIRRIRDAVGTLADGARVLWQRLEPVRRAVGYLVERFGGAQVAATALGVYLGGPLLMATTKLAASLVGVVTAVARVAKGLTVLAARAVPLVLTGLRGLAAAVASAAKGLTALAARALPLVLAGLRSLAVAAMANPVGAVITAVAAGAALLIRYWGPVSAFFENLWGRITGAFQAGRRKLAAVLGFDPLGWVRPAWKGLTGYFGEVMGAARRLLSGEWSAALDLFKLSPLGMVQEAFGKVTSWFANLDWAEHGRRLMGTLASGIKAKATAAVESVRGVLASVREYLPFSDAKRGPLSKLTASGRAIPATLAAGVGRGEGDVVGAVERMAARAGRVPVRPGAAANDAGASAPSAPGRAGGRRGGETRVDFRPRVTIEAGAGMDEQRLAELVRAELARLSGEAGERTEDVMMAGGMA